MCYKSKEPDNERDEKREEEKRGQPLMLLIRL